MVLVAPTEVCLVIPVFNEGAAITESIKVLLEKGLLSQTIFVDDGSDFESKKVLKYAQDKYKIDIITLDSNQGYGKACKTGALAAQERGFTWAIFADSDMTNSPDEILNLRRSIDREFDLIKTSRFETVQGMAQVDRERARISKLASIFCRITFGKIGRDGTNGFRAIRLNSFSDFYPKEKGFSSILEELYFCLTHQARYRYVPTILTKRNELQRETSFTYSMETLLSYAKFCGLAIVFRLFGGLIPSKKRNLRSSLQ